MSLRKASFRTSQERKFQPELELNTCDYNNTSSERACAITLQEESQGDVPEASHREGGHGWAIVASTATISFFYQGLFYSWGVIQAALLLENVSTTTGLSSIGAVTAFFFAISCIPAAWLVNKLGVKMAVIAGNLLLGVSLLLSSFCTRSLLGMIILQGVSIGCADGIIYMGVYPLVATHFLKKRGLATGLQSAGGALGGAIWSVIIERLISKVGLPWTYRVLGLSTLAVCIPLSLVLRPGHVKPTRILGSEVDKNIFKSFMYLKTLVAVFVVSYSLFIPSFFIPQYANSIGFSAKTGALYSSLYNVASGLGRIAFGLLADFFLGNLQAWALSLLFVALSNFFVWPNATTSGAMIAFVFWCGAGSGAYISLQSSVVGQIIGTENVDAGIKWMEACVSIGYLLGPITASSVLESFGGPNSGAQAYRPIMYIAGATNFVAFLLVVWVRFSYSKQALCRV